MFDKQLTMRMGQANVHRWVDDVLPLVSDPDDPLGVLDLRTHRTSLEDAPTMYSMFGTIAAALTSAAAGYPQPLGSRHTATATNPSRRSRKSHRTVSET